MIRYLACALLVAAFALGAMLASPLSSLACIAANLVPHSLHCAMCIYRSSSGRTTANSTKKGGGHGSLLAAHRRVAALDIPLSPVVTADNRFGNLRLVGDRIQVFLPLRAVSHRHLSATEGGRPGLLPDAVTLSQPPGGQARLSTSRPNGFQNP